MSDDPTARLLVALRDARRDGTGVVLLYVTPDQAEQLTAIVSRGWALRPASRGAYALTLDRLAREDV